MIGTGTKNAILCHWLFPEVSRLTPPFLNFFEPQSFFLRVVEARLSRALWEISST